MTTCVFCDVHSSQKKLQCLIICKEVKIYGVTAISCTEIETLSHELLVSEMSIQFIIIYINLYWDIDRLGLCVYYKMSEEEY